MKRPLPVIIVCLSLGFAIGWFARPYGPADTTGDGGGESAGRRSVKRDGETGTGHGAGATKTGPREEASRAGPGKRVVVLGGESHDGEKMEELQEKVEQDLKRRMVNTQRKRLEGRLAKLASELGLNDEQRAKLQQDIERRLQVLEGTGGLAEVGDPDKMKDLAKLLHRGAMDEAVAPLLDEAQAAKHAGLTGREKQARVEARALRDLSGLTTVVDLSAEQRDAIYQVFAGEAAKREEQVREPSMMDVFMADSGVEIHDDLGAMDLWNDEGMRQAVGSADGADAYRQAVQRLVDTRVALLEPHLTAEQLAQYRTHLEQKAASMTEGVMIRAATPAEAGSDEPE